MPSATPHNPSDADSISASWLERRTLPMWMRQADCTAHTLSGWAAGTSAEAAGCSCLSRRDFSGREGALAGFLSVSCSSGMAKVFRRSMLSLVKRNLWLMLSLRRPLGPSLFSGAAGRRRPRYHRPSPASWWRKCAGVPACSGSGSPFAPTRPSNGAPPPR